MRNESLSRIRKMRRLLEQEVETVQQGKCPEYKINGPNQLISAFGKTKEEAMDKITEELRKRAEKLRKDHNSPCEGTCINEESECMLLADIDLKSGFNCYPATSRTKGAGWICVYDGIFGAECFCPDLL